MFKEMSQFFASFLIALLAVSALAAGALMAIIFNGLAPYLKWLDIKIELKEKE